MKRLTKLSELHRFRLKAGFRELSETLQDVKHHALQGAALDDMKRLQEIVVLLEDLLLPVPLANRPTVATITITDNLLAKAGASDFDKIDVEMAFKPVLAPKGKRPLSYCYGDAIFKELCDKLARSKEVRRG